MQYPFSRWVLEPVHKERMEFYIVKSGKDCVKFLYFKISSFCSLLYVLNVSYIIFYNILNYFTVSI